MGTKITDRIVYQAGMNRIPISGTFELTPMCNFSCKMCYIRKNQKDINASGGLKTAEQWLNWAEQAKKEGMLYLLLTGGEPLIYPEFWELYKELTQMGFVISINSNGSMITEEVAARFAEMPPRKINITLYGASNTTYKQLCGVEDGLDRVINAAQFLQQYKVKYKYNCSLTPYNKHELKDVFMLAKSQKVPIEIATYMFPPVRRNTELKDYEMRLTPEEAGYYSVESMSLQLSKEQFLAYARHKIMYETPPVLDEINESSRKKKAMGCRAGRCSFWLDWQGNLSSCGMINMPRYSLENQSFDQAWKQVVKETDKITCMSGCSGCKNQKICHACISTAYCETGDINGRPEYACRMIEAEAKECERRISKMNTKF